MAHGLRTWLLCGAGAVLAGCATPSATPPSIATPASWEQPVASDAPAWPDKEWWHGFASAELDSLIGEARSDNPSLAAAEARVRQADARARQAGAALLPTLALNANAGKQWGQSNGASASENDYGANLGAGYELDFWGKNRDAADSASALARASLADRETVALTTTAAVADAYFQLLSLRERLAVARASLASSRDIAGLIERRVRAGSAAPADLALQNANAASEAALVPELENQEAAARIALAFLLGRPPEGFTVAAQNLDAIAAPAIAPGLPSALLLRRPDVASAEANLTAAQADVAAARAAFFPTIALTTTAGVQSPAFNGALTTLGGLGTAVMIGGTLAETIFDGGLRQAKTDEALAHEEELLAQYRNAALTAFSDVETALAGNAYLAREQAADEEFVTLAGKGLIAAQNRYRAGTTDFLAVIDAERTLYTARNQLAQVKLARLQAVTALYKALGGGWDGDATAGKE